MSLRVVSTFSGIGGLDLGLEQAGLPGPAVLCESNEFARAVLAKRYPGVPILEDIQTFPAELAEDSILVGGFPCQDISAAGKGKGLEGSRSGLWWAFDRVIAQARPPAVIVENVASAGNRWVDQVRDRLSVLDYAVLPLKLSAEDVGAPHQRRRWFLIGLRRDVPMGRGVPSSDHYLASDVLLALSGVQMSLFSTQKPVQRIIDERFADLRYGSRSMNQWQKLATSGRIRSEASASELFPTPTASRYGSSNNGDPHDGLGQYATRGKPSLWTMLKRPTAAAGGRWATAVVTDAKASGRRTTVGRPGNTMKPGLSMTDVLRMHRGEELFLNPDFVEALMGLPVGWTNLDVDSPVLYPFPPPPADTERNWQLYIECHGGPPPGVPEGEQGPNAAARLRACGNAVVPDCAQVVGAVLLALLGGRP